MINDLFNNINNNNNNNNNNRVSTAAVLDQKAETVKGKRNLLLL